MKRVLAALFSVIAVTILIAGCSRTESTEATAPAAETTSEAAEKSSGADTVSSASIVDTVAGLVKAASEDGTWIIALTGDLESSQEIVLDGEFVHRDEIYRKLALYAQDEERNITARYTLTAPRLVVGSENARIQGGTFKGDVYVRADKFHIYDGVVDGDVIFAEEAFKSSFSLQEGGKVTGSLRVE
jgi:hypothetical protein